jgi:hypothetical protein
MKKSCRPGWSVGKVALALAWIVGLLLVAMVVPQPFHGRLASALGDMIHAPAFAVLGMAGYILGRRLGVSRLWAAGGVLLLVCAFGLATEVLQRYVGRSDSWEDWFNDVLGGAAGVLIGSALETPMWRAKIGAVTVGLMLILAGEVDAASRVWDCIQQQREMPLLASFEGWRELSRWAAHDAQLQRVADHATEGDHGLQVDFFPSHFPTVVLTEPGDWSAYTELVFDIEVVPDGDHPGEPLNLIVKIEDCAHNGQYEDRFHRQLKLAPGKHEVRIPLSDVAGAPLGRSMDMSQLHVLQLFAIRPPRQRTFYLDHIRLE